MMQLNSRADLELLRDTPEFEVAMRGIYGSMTGWALVDGAWVAAVDLSVLNRFSFTQAAFLAEIDGFDFAAPVPPPIPVEPPPAPYQLYKSVFIRRLAEPEAATMEAVFAAADARLRLLFNSVEYFVSDDELFDTLVAAVGQALGAERAAELLAEE